MYFCVKISILKRIYTFLLGLFVLNFSYSQDLIVTVLDNETSNPVENVQISYEKLQFETGNEGYVTLEVDFNKPIFLVAEKKGYEPFETVINDPKGMNQFTIRLKPTATSEPNNIILLELDELQDDTQNSGTSSLLRSSRDIYQSAAAFSFFAARFRVRGYQNDYSDTYINGLPMMNLHNSRVPFNYWGGLNDMFRLSSPVIGLDHSENMFGDINGGSAVELGALSQRKQWKSSYASSNRSYRNRIMSTYSTGELPSGWAFSLSGSRRWAEQGYIEGTFYDAWSYLVSIEKRLKNNHQFGLVFFGAPRKNGRSSGSVNEMYELSDNNYYNPNWGFQEGEVRNSRYYDTHQPVINLRYKGEINEKVSMTHSVGFLFGSSAGSRLDWYNAPDPRPDYYRNLPSWYEGEAAEEVADLLSSNQKYRQVQWDKLYETNDLHYQTIFNANGIEGNTVEGNRSLYALQEERDDTRRFMYNGIGKYKLKENMEVNFGLSYQNETTHFYKNMVDLLGGDYWLDVDQFAERENTTDPDVIQSNLLEPNHVVYAGDTYGFNYKSHVQDFNAWLGYLARLNKWDIHLGIQANYNQFYREGLYQDGNFPDESLGDSEVASFFSPSAKAGINYKINGRNYIYTNGMYQHRPPDFRNTFLSNRTRNKIIDNPTTEKITSGEIAYVHKSPSLKFKALGYYTIFDDVVELDAFYLDGTNSFVNYIMSDISRIHRGTELSAEYKLTSTFSVKAAAGIGQHFYSNRPTLNIVADLGPAVDLGSRADEQVVYIENFRVPGPQTAAMFGLSYNSPKYWFANLTINYFDNIYLDFNPDRRTEYAVRNIVIENQQELFENTVRQTKLEPAFTVDFFGGKSWKIDDHYIYLNVGVNNILNNRSFITGGFEQSRLGFDDYVATQDQLDQFPNRYFYAYGVNYFVSLAYKI